MPPPPVAPATYVVGAGVTGEQQAVVKGGLDIASGYFQSELGRDLPPTTVYLDDDLEGIVSLFASTAPATTADSRRIWETAAAVADPRKVWVFVGSSSWSPPDWNRAKILGHEAFHVMQFEVSGPQPHRAGFDEVPRAGPRWLQEGSAEYIGYKAIASARLTEMSRVRDQWKMRSKLTTSPLRSRETTRGLFSEPEPYQLSPLAVDFLVAGRSDNLLTAYYEAIGRGEEWHSAFAAVFGKSVDTFYNEFEAYRRNL
jgi:hypothetical protein